jgi:hypothetical protein
MPASRQMRSKKVEENVAAKQRGKTTSVAAEVNTESSLSVCFLIQNLMFVFVYYS